MALPTPEGYRALDEAAVAGYLAGLPELAERLGGSAGDWRVREVGDGNLNLVFIVEGPAGGLCLKQSLPYVRLVGESWPLPLDRITFEHAALCVEGELAPGLVPAVYHFDPAMYLVAMERLAPHIILRRGMIEAREYPKLAAHMAEFCAATLFGTSDLALPAAEKKAKVAQFCANTALCKITEDLIFTDPYRVAELNRWTSPQLDEDAARVRADAELKRAISALKLKFLCHGEALIHGDLHTGSLMVTEDDTRAIDCEFAFFGPMAFDTGKLIGNLLMNHFSQDGHAVQNAQSREDYQTWVLDQVEAFWTGFAARFAERWDGPRDGDAYPADLFSEQESRAAARDAFVQRLFTDSLGFAAAAMIRRTLGLAHNIDFEWIEDPDQRAACERRNLHLARDLMVNAAAYPNISAVTAAARRVRAGEPPR